jgi:glutamine amidotransferase-like uncharacterized protein
MTAINKRLALTLNVALGMLLSWFVTLSSARGDGPKQPRVIRVAIYSGNGVTPGDAEQVKACMPASQGFAVRIVTAKEIRDGGLDQFDVLIHPGGSGSGQAKALGDQGRELVRNFVRRGGGYVGICAGAYLASAEYPWALKLLDARVIDDEHWARGVGKVTLSVPAQGQSALGTNDLSTEMHYENGPLLGPADQKDIPNFETLATFNSEIRKNDAPEGIMKGTTAIARGQFGHGRVVCFSTHPEKSRGREGFVVELVRWAGESESDHGFNNRRR